LISSSPEPTKEPAEDAEPQSEGKQEEQEKVFELNLSMSKFDHEHYIANEVLFGPWKPVDRKHNFLAGSLEMPRNLMSSGLRDWETEKLKWRNFGDDDAFDGMGVGGIGGKGSGKDRINAQWRFHQRQKWRAEKKRMEGVMAGLKDFHVDTKGENGAKDVEPGAPPAMQDWYKFRGIKVSGFGAWPGKHVKGSGRERETERKGEMDGDGENKMATRAIDPREWPVR
jgi:hypothetical protein